jgi:hypothetical protein
MAEARAAVDNTDRMGSGADVRAEFPAVHGEEYPSPARTRPADRRRRKFPDAALARLHLPLPGRIPLPVVICDGEEDAANRPDRSDLSRID